MGGKINRSMKFGVPIFDIELDGYAQHRQPLIEHFLAMREEELDDKGRSNVGGWHSRDDLLFKSNHPSVKWLVRSLAEASAQAIRQADLLPRDQDVVMSGCWVNINEAGDWNAPHLHLPDEWAGAFYLDVNNKGVSEVKSERDGDIIFFNPLPLGVQYARAPTISAKPTNGKLFFFPGYLLHMVAPHFENKPRISVAFNLKFTPRAPAR